MQASSIEARYVPDRRRPGRAMLNFLLPGHSVRFGRDERDLLRRHRGESGVVVSIRYPLRYSKVVVVDPTWWRLLIDVGAERIEDVRSTKKACGPFWLAPGTGTFEVSVRRALDDDELVAAEVDVVDGRPSLVRIGPATRSGWGLKASHPSRIEAIPAW